MSCEAALKSCNRMGGGDPKIVFFFQSPGHGETSPRWPCGSITPIETSLTVALYVFMPHQHMGSHYNLAAQFLSWDRTRLSGSDKDPNNTCRKSMVRQRSVVTGSAWRNHHKDRPGHSKSARPSPLAPKERPACPDALVLPGARV